MQLLKFKVIKLFGVYDHQFYFPSRSETDNTPSLIILHGKNGVGKTTILRMIHGFLNLDFNPFRNIPFQAAYLQFTDNSCISVLPGKDKRGEPILKVTYKHKSVKLNGRQPGPFNEVDTEKIELFRKYFFNEIESINLDFIDTNRLLTRVEENPNDVIDQLYDNEDEAGDVVIRRVVRKEKKTLKNIDYLSTRVRKFIREAQVNYRRYFTTTEPDLFPKIIDKIANNNSTSYSKKELLLKLRNIYSNDQKATKFGLTIENYDYKQLKTILLRLKPQQNHTLTVIGTYLDFLESRSSARSLIVERLFTFEKVVNSLIKNKSIKLTRYSGLVIETTKGKQLTEKELSSGEYHLLYLLVSALVTKRRGTVIAIDEPELSMHLEWQRKLIPAIFQCASMAQPQLILATHSPDIAAEYPEAMVKIE